MTAPDIAPDAPGGPLPVRAGPRPRTTTINPHMQLDQQPARSNSAALIEAERVLPGVVLAPSRRAPTGTVGFYPQRACASGPRDIR